MKESLELTAKLANITFSNIQLLTKEKMTTKNLTDQPKPVSGFGDMWERIMKRYDFDYYLEKENKDGRNSLICDEKLAYVMRDRRQFGIDKYGTALQAFNGRNAIEDLMAEQLDSLVYSEQVLLEHPKLAQEMLDWQKNTLKLLRYLFIINEEK